MLSPDNWNLATWDAPSRMLLLSIVVVIVGLEGLRLFQGRQQQWGPSKIRPVGVGADRDAVLYIVPLLILINALDIKGFFLIGLSPWRYLLVAGLAVIAISGLKSYSHYGKALVYPSLALSLWLMSGATIALLFVNPVSSSLPIAASSLFLLIFLTTAPKRERDWAFFCGAVEIAAYTYLLVHLGSAIGLIDTGVNRSVGSTALYTNGAFTHEKGAILMIAAHCAVRRRSWVFQALVAACIGYIYFAYPAGTYPLVAIAYAASMFVLKRPKPHLRTFVVAILAVAFYVVVLVTSSAALLGSAYYSAVGKTSNVSTRGVLWEAAISKIVESPILGTGFAGAATVEVSQGNLVPDVPPHNDYLQLLLLGGGVALGIFATLLFVALAGLERQFVSWHADASLRLAQELCVVAIISFLVIFCFNPVLLKLSLGCLFFAVIGILPLLVGAPDKLRDVKLKVRPMLRPRGSA